MKLIDKEKVVDEIERRIDRNNEKAATYSSNSEHDYLYKVKEAVYKNLLSFINTLEVKEVIAEQECTCNEALNRIIGGSWNLLCPVNKLGLKTGDKVKIIIKA